VRALVVGASGGLGSALLAQLDADARYTQIMAWSRSASVVTGRKILANHIDLRDEATIAAAAHSLGEVEIEMKIQIKEFNKKTIQRRNIRKQN
jgi:uncharacterized protein YbjT (DUF2867 family)